MFLKKLNYFNFILLYQTPCILKVLVLNELDSKNLSKYFSGIVAFEIKIIQKH